MSSICEGAGYDEVYPSGRKPEEDLTWSPKGNRLLILPPMGKSMKRMRKEEVMRERKERMKKEKMKRNKERVMWGNQEEGDRLVD